jgi:predicted HTH domain antitoxin
MATITFDLPDDVLRQLGDCADDVGSEIRLAAALYWCSRGEMSTSLAARLAGLSYADFLDVAARKHVELFSADSKKLEQELRQPLPEGTDLEKIRQELGRARAAGS